MVKFATLIMVPLFMTNFGFAAPAIPQQASLQNADTSIQANASPSQSRVGIALMPAQPKTGGTPIYPMLKSSAQESSANFINDNLNDYVISFIKDYYKDNNRNLQVVQSRGTHTFNLITAVFDKTGIPEELKYLAVIESGLNSNAVSRTGAVGTWQLMAGTARLLGLRVNKHQDDRRNVYKSTMAAAKYLNQLHSSLDDWLLVVAAYNCGPGGVMKAIEESGSKNFWDLQQYLPAESRRHVMKFLATAYIMDRFAQFFGISSHDMQNLRQASAAADVAPEDASAAASPAPLATLQISGKYSLPVIAKYLSMSITELNHLNPDFDQVMASATNTYELKLPPAKMEVFKLKKDQILNESVQVLMENNQQVLKARMQSAQ